MSFLSPAFLFALPLVAVPLVIHFFNRRQRDPIRWGAMEFLLATQIRRRRFMRWRDLLLLLLRIAIVLAIIGALAQPMLSSNWIGSTGPRDVVLIVDNSMSTARRLDGGTVFERELSEADGILKKLGPTDTARVLLTSPSPQWLNDAPAAGASGALRELEGRLDESKPNDGSADMMQCAQAALQAHAAGKDVSRLITILTDGQAHGWRAETPGSWTAIRALADKAPFPVVLRVLVPEGVSKPSANLAVEKIAAARPVVAVGQPATLTAFIKNTGNSPSPAGSLSWSTRAESLGLGAIPALDPGAGTTVSLSQPFAAPGMVDVSCRLSAKDDLPPDNTARFLLDVTQSVPILVVEGEPQADPNESDTRFFLASLGYGESGELTPAASIFHPKLVNYEKLRDEELSAFQCVVLSDVPRLPPELVEKLARYVNSGGGLWIALGEQTDVSAFNQAFFEQNAGLSGLPLRQPAGNAEDHEKFIRLVPPSADAPATALLADTKRLDIDRAQIYRRHQFDTDAAGSVSVLLRAEGGAPVAIERDLGRGRVIVLSVPFGVEWSNLPLLHSYVVLTREWLWYLTEAGLVKRNLQAGELLQLSAPLETTSASASLETPLGRVVQLFGQEEDGRLVFRYPKTQAPGEYRLTLSDSRQGSRTEPFLVGRDPEESNLTPLTGEQIRNLSDKSGMAFGGDPLFQPRTQKVRPPPKALATWLLVALLIFLAAELGMAFWMAHRRRAAAPAVVLEPSVRA